MSSFRNLIDAIVRILGGPDIRPDTAESGFNRDVIPAELSLDELTTIIIRDIVEIRGFGIKSYERNIIIKFRLVDAYAWWIYLENRIPSRPLPILYFQGIRLLELIKKVSDGINQGQTSLDPLFSFTDAEEERIRIKEAQALQEMYIAKMSRLASDNEIFAIDIFAELATLEFSSRLDIFSDTLRKFKDDFDSEFKNRLTKLEYKAIISGWMRSSGLDLDNCAPIDLEETDILDLPTQPMPLSPFPDIRDEFREELKKRGINTGEGDSVQYPCGPDGITPVDVNPNGDDTTDDPNNPDETISDKVNKYSDQVVVDFNFLLTFHFEMCRLLKKAESNMFIIDEMTNLKTSQINKRDIFNKFLSDNISFIDGIRSIITADKCSSIVGNISPGQDIDESLQKTRNIINEYINVYSNLKIDLFDNIEELNRLKTIVDVSVIGGTFEDILSIANSDFEKIKSYNERIKSFEPKIGDEAIPFIPVVNPPEIDIVVEGINLRPVSGVTTIIADDYVDRMVGIINRLASQFSINDFNTISSNVNQSREDVEQLVNEIKDNIDSIDEDSLFNLSAMYQIFNDAVQALFQLKNTIQWNVYSSMLSIWNNYSNEVGFAIVATSASELSRRGRLGFKSVAIATSIGTSVYVIWTRPTFSERINIINKIQEKIDKGLQEDAIIEIIIELTSVHDFINGWLYSSQQISLIETKLNELFNKALNIPGKVLNTEEEFYDLLGKLGNKLPLTTRANLGMQSFVRNLKSSSFSTYVTISDWVKSTASGILGFGTNLVLLGGAALLLLGLAQSGNVSGMGNQVIIAGALGVGLLVFFSNRPGTALE